MTIALTPELEERIKAEADRRGVEVNQLANELIAQALPQPDQATLDLINRWEAEDRTDDPIELARRRKEFEEFKVAMNRNRLESEGPDARIPFP